MNCTGLRSLSSAMSWLYELTSKLRCRITSETARMMAGASDVTYWSWSPRITRILDLLSLAGTETSVRHAKPQNFEALDRTFLLT